MQRNRIILSSFIILIVIILTITALWIPQETNPAFATALAFVNTAAIGDDQTAMTYLDESLKVYVQNNCPDRSVSRCLIDYTPPEWGKFSSAVYRRSQPDGAAWDIQLIATYEKGQGFSGVCIYNRAEFINGSWLITRWSGFQSCAQSNSGLNELIADDAPNRAP